MARSRNWAIDILLNDVFREDLLRESLIEHHHLVNYFYAKDVGGSCLRGIINFKSAERHSFPCKIFEQFSKPDSIRIVKNPIEFLKLLQEETGLEITFGNVPPGNDELLSYLETMSCRQEALDFIKEHYKHMYYFQTNSMEAMLDRMYPAPLSVKEFKDEDFLIQRLPGGAFPQFDNKDTSSRVRTLLLTGQPHTGKSALAVHIFKRTFPHKVPIIVSDIQDLRKYVASVHSGIIFDDMDFSSLSPSEVLKFIDFEQEKTVSKIKYGSAHIPRHVFKIITMNDYSTFLPWTLRKAEPTNPLLLALKSRIHHIEVTKCLIRNCNYSPEESYVKASHEAICNFRSESCATPILPNSFQDMQSSNLDSPSFLRIPFLLGRAPLQTPKPYPVGLLHVFIFYAATLRLSITASSCVYVCCSRLFPNFNVFQLLRDSNISVENLTLLWL